MAGVVQSVDLRELDAWSGRYVSSLQDLTVPLKRCAVLISAATKENFAGSHEPDGTPWPPLKYPRANSRGSDKPLRDKGLLMASASASGAGHVEELTPRSLVYGTNLDYAAVHQNGATINRTERTRKKPWVFKVGGKTVFTRRIRAHQVVIPARTFSGITTVLVDKFNMVFTDWLDEKK